MTTTDPPAAEPVELPTYTLLRQALITHALRRFGPLSSRAYQARELAEALADDILDPSYVALLDEKLSELRATATATATDLPAPPPTAHRWQAGDDAAWRGRAVTVISPPDNILVELPSGNTANVDPDELVPYAP